MNCEFPNTKITFLDDDGMDELPLHRKLGHMANKDGANVGSAIFSYGINRCDFPDVFETILNNEGYNGLSLDNIVVYRRRLTFLLKPEEKGASFVNLDVYLSGTCGKIQVNKGEDKFAVIEWTNGEVQSFEAMVFGSRTSMYIQD